MTPDKKLGNRILEAIKSSGFQHNEVAEHIGVSPQAISQAIRKNAMRESNLRKMAEKTGVDPMWLIYGDTETLLNFDIDLMAQCDKAIRKAAKELGMKHLDDAEVVQAAYRLYKANA